MMLSISKKFHEDILNGFQVIEWIGDDIKKKSYLGPWSEKGAFPNSQ